MNKIKSKALIRWKYKNGKRLTSLCSWKLRISNGSPEWSVRRMSDLVGVLLTESTTPDRIILRKNVRVHDWNINGMARWYKVVIVGFAMHYIICKRNYIILKLTWWISAPLDCTVPSSSTVALCIIFVITGRKCRGLDFVYLVEF